MRRRELILLLGGAADCCWRAAPAQTSGIRPVVAWLGVGAMWAASRYLGFLRERLGEQGDIEGENFDIVPRFPEFHPEQRLLAVAEEVVALRPAIIVCAGVDAVVAVRKATSTIPIVTAALADAEHFGVGTECAHPGGNVTGITPYVTVLPTKQLEIAREIVPDAKKLGLLGNMNDPKAPPQRHELEEAAGALGVKVLVPDIAVPDDVEPAIEVLTRERVDVVIVLQTTIILDMCGKIRPALTANRLPAVYCYREHVDNGGLISYGVDLAWCHRRLAVYVHKILNGAKPADLPVEFPSRLQLVINLKAAKTLGVTMSPLLLTRADEVIE